MSLFGVTATGIFQLRLSFSIFLQYIHVTKHPRADVTMCVIKMEKKPSVVAMKVTDLLAKPRAKRVSISMT